MAPVDSPVLADFMALLDPINAVADATPGFVWRLQTTRATPPRSIYMGDDTLNVNMSVWESEEALWDYVYASEHLAVMRRRREWFKRIEQFMCLWWVPPGTARHPGGRGAADAASREGAGARVLHLQAGLPGAGAVPPELVSTATASSSTPSRRPPR